MKRIVFWGVVAAALSILNYYHSADTRQLPPTNPTQPTQTIQLEKPLQLAEPEQIPLAEPVIVEPKAQPKPAAPKVTEPSLALINQTRADKGLSQLTIYAPLTSSTAAKCAHMVEHDYWAHSGGGREWSSFITAKYTQAGEILATGWTTNAAQHQGWLDSPPHYKAIVGNFKYFGIGRCAYKDGRSLTVVHFMR